MDIPNPDKMSNLYEKSSTVLLKEEEEDRLMEAWMTYSDTETPVPKEKVYEDILYFLDKLKADFRRIGNLTF